jgi:predicted nucleotidyltransferase
MESTDKNIISSFKVQKELNPDIWLMDDEGYKMRPEIRDSLLKIVEDYEEFVDIDLDIEDIILTGSLSNFNWSEFSDVDLHILIDFEDPSESIEKKYLDSRRIIWNSLRDVNVKGFESEIYVQDSKEQHFASGMYSVMYNDWVVKPEEKEVVLDSHKILSKSKQWMDMIDQIEDNMERTSPNELMQTVDDLKRRLKKYRGAGLADKGEYSYENLTFKFLRRNGYIGKLMGLKNKLIDKSLTLEDTVSDS